MCNNLFGMSHVLCTMYIKVTFNCSPWKNSDLYDTLMTSFLFSLQMPDVTDPQTLIDKVKDFLDKNKKDPGP